MRPHEDTFTTSTDSRNPISQADEQPEVSVKELDYEVVIKESFKRDTNSGFELLFKFYYRPLCSHAIRFVASKEVAEDIVSDVFFKFHTDEIYRTIETSYRAYLYTMVRNKAYDYFRISNSKNLSIDDFAFELSVTSEEHPDQVTQYEDLYRDVERAIDSLPSKRRQIFIMHRFEGKKYQEIALQLSLSLRTVEAQMYLATQQVRKLIQQKWFLSFLVSWVLC